MKTRIPECTLAGLAAAEDRVSIPVLVTCLLEVGGGQAHRALDIEGVQANAMPIEVLARLHECRQTARQHLDLPADRALLPGELGPQQLYAPERSLKFPGRRRSRTHDRNDGGLSLGAARILPTDAWAEDHISEC